MQYNLSGAKTGPKRGIHQAIHSRTTRLSSKFIHQPWLAPVEVQEDVECVIGQNYPMPMIDLAQASHINCNRMKKIRDTLTADLQPHVRPSNDEEIRNFFWIADESSIKCN